MNICFSLEESKKSKRARQPTKQAPRHHPLVLQDSSVMMVSGGFASLKRKGSQHIRTSSKTSGKPRRLGWTCGLTVLIFCAGGRSRSIKTYSQI